MKYLIYGLAVIGGWFLYDSFDPVDKLITLGFCLGVSCISISLFVIEIANG